MNHTFPIDRRNVLIIKIFSGSGHYMDYIVLGEIIRTDLSGRGLLTVVL
jgi:hypothetical protein